MRNRERGSSKLKIGIKYCGGCNPGYDRVAVVARLKAQLTHIDFIPHHGEDAEAILIVAGCATACVDREPFGRLPVYTVTSEDGVDVFVKKMRKK